MALSSQISAAGSAGPVSLGPNILLIEDNEDDAFLFNWAISKSGLNWQLHIFSDWDEARTWMRGATPEAIVTDFHLKRGTALAEVRRLRTTAGFEQIPVVLLSGDASMEPLDFEGLDVSAFLEKTPDTAELANRVMNALSAPRLPLAPTRVDPV